MKTTAKLFCLAVVLALAAGAGFAQEKPNFSGEWTLNAAKSDFGPFPAPAKFIRKIAHEEPNLHTVTTQAGERGEFTTELRYTTDGKESVNTIRGQQIKGVAKWDGSALVIESKRTFQDTELTITEKWRLSEDKKTLSIDTHIAGPQGEADLKFVLDRKES